MLSPFHAVTRTGLGRRGTAPRRGRRRRWVRGRPGPPLAPARAARRSRPTGHAALPAFVLVLLAYELLLGLTVPPNNGDALGYHLPKAAAWAQHGALLDPGRPDRPDERVPAVRGAGDPLPPRRDGRGRAHRSSAVRGDSRSSSRSTARRAGSALRRALGGGARSCSRPSRCSRSRRRPPRTTSWPPRSPRGRLPAPWRGRLEPALGGVAVGIGLGAKLTDRARVAGARSGWRSRRAAAAAAGPAGGAVGFVAIGIWGYVLNAAHTGHVLGVGTGSSRTARRPRYPGSVANGFYLLYGLMDVSVLSNRLIDWLAIAAFSSRVGVAVWAFRRRGLGARFRRRRGCGSVPRAAARDRRRAALIAFVADGWASRSAAPDGVLPGQRRTSADLHAHLERGLLGVRAVGIASLLSRRARGSGRRAAAGRPRHLALALPCRSSSC